MAKTIVHLIRHGMVENPARILYGRLPNYGLSTHGQAMAELVAKEFCDADVTYLAASPMLRAQQTAAPISVACGLSIETDDRLNEAVNVFQGMRFSFDRGAALRKFSSYPKLWNPFKPSWGEPYTEIVSRMVAAVQTAREAARGHQAILVSHQLPIWVLRLHLQNQHLWHSPKKRQCALVSVTSLSFDNDRLTSIDYQEPVGPTSPDVPAGA